MRVLIQHRCHSDGRNCVQVSRYPEEHAQALTVISPWPTTEGIQTQRREAQR